jgi:hypothetical protein
VAQAGLAANQNRRVIPSRFTVYKRVVNVPAETVTRTLSSNVVEAAGN